MLGGLRRSARRRRQGRRSRRAGDLRLWVPPPARRTMAPQSPRVGGRQLSAAIGATTEGENIMNRRRLDIIFSIGGAALAVVLLVLGLVLQNQAYFAKSYVKDQLAEQKITFTPVKGLA